MSIFQMKMTVRKDKVDELLGTLRALTCNFSEYKESLSYDVYQGVEQTNNFCIIADLKSEKALKDHFNSRNFKILMGAARTLSEDFKLVIANDVKKGSFELVNYIN